MTKNFLIVLAVISLITLIAVLHFFSRAYERAHITDVLEEPQTEATTTPPVWEEPVPTTVTGYWECLPLKEGSEETTLECAFGVAIDESDGHIAIDTGLMSQTPVTFETGAKVMVTGIVTPVEALSSVQRYDIDGVMRATSIERVTEQDEPTLAPSLLKRWEWESASFNDGSTLSPKKDDFAVTLAEDGSFTAETDCNSVGGRYQIEKGAKLSFTDIYSTKMFCEGSLESDFVTLLQNTAGYHFTPTGELVLSLKFDSGTVLFK